MNAHCQAFPAVTIKPQRSGTKDIEENENRPNAAVLGKDCGSPERSQNRWRNLPEGERICRSFVI